MKIRLINILYICLCLLLFPVIEAGAKLFYSPSQYNKVYNEKVAAELEVKSITRQYKNEKSSLESEIRNLNSIISNLEEQIHNCQKKSDKEKELSDARIAELEKTIEILKKKSGSREQQLVEENSSLRTRYETALSQLKKELEQERESCVKKIDNLRKEYNKKIDELEQQIRNLNAELASMKKLSKSQKEELERMSRQAQELEEKLKQEISLGQIRLKRFHDRLIINIDDRISFDSGSADLKKEILPALKKIREILVEYPEYSIMIEGHTDNIPIKTSRFGDNWQLSTERALSVLRYMLMEKELNKSRFAAAGYGEYNPIVPNDTAKNRSLNRRVDIVVIPRLAK